MKNLLTRVAKMLTMMGLTQGMSEIQPEMTLPTVLVIPIMEIRNEASSGPRPRLSPI